MQHEDLVMSISEDWVYWKRSLDFTHKHYNSLTKRQPRLTNTSTLTAFRGVTGPKNLQDYLAAYLFGIHSKPEGKLEDGMIKIEHGSRRGTYVQLYWGPPSLCSEYQSIRLTWVVQRFSLVVAEPATCYHWCLVGPAHFPIVIVGCLKTDCAQRADCCYKIEHCLKAECCRQIGYCMIALATQLNLGRNHHHYLVQNQK